MISSVPSKLHKTQHKDDQEQAREFEGLTTHIDGDTPVSIINGDGDTEMDVNHLSTNLPVIAMATQFMEDENDALELLPNGNVAIVPEMVEMPEIKEEHVDLRIAYEEEEPAPNDIREMDEPECLICMTEVTEIMRDAERDGKGGTGGGMAPCGHASCRIAERVSAFHLLGCKSRILIAL
jgi:hypothetical protein